MGCNSLSKVVAEIREKRNKRVEVDGKHGLWEVNSEEVTGSICASWKRQGKFGGLRAGMVRLEQWQ